MENAFKIGDIVEVINNGKQCTLYELKNLNSFKGCLINDYKRYVPFDIEISKLIQLFKVALCPETKKKKDSLKFILNLKR